MTTQSQVTIPTEYLVALETVRREAAMLMSTLVAHKDTPPMPRDEQRRRLAMHIRDTSLALLDVRQSYQ